VDLDKWAAGADLEYNVGGIEVWNIEARKSVKERYEQRIVPDSNELAAIAETRQALINYYEHQRPYLETSTQKIVGSFLEEEQANCSGIFISHAVLRFSLGPIYAALREAAPELRKQIEKAKNPLDQEEINNRFKLLEQDLAEAGRGGREDMVGEAVKRFKAWDYQIHLDALEAEAYRVKWQNT
jgi:hypothetical protein